jgi:UDP-N-acetylmuramoylalanine--D-glutamate ligase
MCEALASFEGVEGRLQFVRELKGVKIYNDNNATTPEATIAALRALRESGSRKEESGIILILGGADKGLEMSELATEINNSCKAAILLKGTGTEKLSPILDSSIIIHTPSPFESLQSAVAKALEVATSGDIILFSPAFASFGMFKNEYDRNDQFMDFVHRLE